MPAGLQIAFFGSSLVSAYWNGAATYYRGIIRALADRGHRISFFEPDAFERQQHRDGPDPSWAQVVVYPSGNDEGVRWALDRAQHMDLVIKCSGVGVFDQFLESAVLEIRKPGGLVAFWDVDAPATLDRIHKDPSDPFSGLIPRYDLILTYGGGDRVVRRYEELGARVCVPIYNALDPVTHYRVPPDSKFEADLAFLGNRLPDREARIEEFFLRAARYVPEHHFLLGGSGWRDKPLPSNVNYLGHVYTGDHNSLNSTARAVLNVNRNSMADYGFSPPTRIFEAAGAGACIITDEWDGIESFLEPDREVLVARNGPEVADHLQLLTPQRSQQIGFAAQRRILGEHTYAHRALQFESVLTIRSSKLEIRDSKLGITRSSGF
jgi:spore maturation protein CgeB